MPATIPADGTYTVVVNDSNDGSRSGSYTLSLLRLNRPCSSSPLNCGGTAAGNLTRALDSGVYTYTPGGGESFSGRTLPNTGGIPPPEIYHSPSKRTRHAVTRALPCD